MTDLNFQVVHGASIDPSLKGLYIEREALPIMEEFLSNAVGESTCFIWCWNHKSAIEAKAKAVALLKSIARFCTPTNLQTKPGEGHFHEVVLKASIESALYYIRKFSNGDTFSASEVDEARKHLDEHKELENNGLRPPPPYSQVGLCYKSYSLMRTHRYEVSCEIENKRSWQEDGEIICEFPNFPGHVFQ